jgi:hypothetical protein
MHAHHAGKIPTTMKKQISGQCKLSCNECWCNYSNSFERIFVVCLWPVAAIVALNGDADERENKK